jgi:predicted house-cleaning noncanonical NTP pyrophosphatase (MazG superfamily)
MQKLVRDNIPEIIEREGGKVVQRVLLDDEYKTELSKKLIEEANEFMRDENIEELADVFEVFEAIMRTYGFTQLELEAARAKKNTTKGAFTKRIYVESVM